MNILIAEDQPPAALWLRHVLERRGHEVEVAADGEAAWQKLRATGCRLVLADWMMPRLDGLALCRRIRAEIDSPYIYYVLLTGRDGRDDRLEGLRAGADDLMTKPIDPDELDVRLAIAGRILAVHEALARRNALLAQMASTDPLTGIKNRRRFAEDLEHHVALLARHGRPLSLLMLDVDWFKSYNDEFGHPAGDELLCSLAEALRLELRESDVLARYGGEEFAVLLPATDAAAAREVAERLREVVAALPTSRRQVTISVGAATAEAGAACDPARLLERADAALYQAKRSGRNRVVSASEGPWAVPATLSILPGDKRRAWG